MLKLTKYSKDVWELFILIHVQYMFSDTGAPQIRQSNFVTWT